MKGAEPLFVDESQRKRLFFLVRSGGTPQKVARRARLILMAADGATNTAIAEATGFSRQAVITCRRRFQERGIASVQKDAHRAGRKPAMADSKVQEIINATLHVKPKNATHWSTRSFAKEYGVSHITVHRIWRCHNIQPHRIKQFKLSNDKDFVPKVRDIIGLYLSPPERALILSVDEKSQIQALDRTQPGFPLKKGRCATLTHDYKRHGTTTLFAALNMLDGTVIGQCLPRHRSEEFLKFLKIIDQRTPPDLAVHLIVDNYGTHKTAKVGRWLKKRPRFTLHFTPTSSSWLNMIERWFRELTVRRLRRGVFHSVKDLVSAIDAYLAAHNSDPKVFTWTKDAETVLAKVAKCKEALETVH